MNMMTNSGRTWRLTFATAPSGTARAGPARGGVKAFAVARSDVAVYVEIAWQGRLQRAWVPRDTVTTRKLSPRRD